MKEAVDDMCELCRSSAARAHCESDRARLCWECDAKVHAANFLVAKHTRSLLCHICHSPTPWKASGHILPRVAMSLCISCTSPPSVSHDELTLPIHTLIAAEDDEDDHDER